MGDTVVVTLRDDDGIRHGISAEKLGKLPAAFAPGGSTTAGNSSQVTDGCSVCMLMSRSEAQRRGLPVLGTFRSFSVVGLDPAIMGSVLGSGSQRATECRVGMFLAGFPEKVPVHTVNRQCSSGLQAIAHAAANIKAGYYKIAIAGGVESMSTNPMTWEGGANPRIEENDMAAACLIPMG